MVINRPNKHNIRIIGDADSPDGDNYAKEQAERNFNRLNTVFGIIDSTLESCKSKEGSWFLQNIIFNIFMRMGSLASEKEYFIESMSFMYDMVESEKKRVEDLKQTKDKLTQTPQPAPVA